MSLEENRKFCALMKQHPQLYDEDHKDYKQRMVTDEAWQTIAESLGKSAAKCKERWRNLRAAYARSIGVYKTKRGKNSEKSYYLAEHLEFLRPHLCKAAAVDATENAEDMSTDMSATSSSGNRVNEKRDTCASENENQRDSTCFPFINNNLYRSMKLKLNK